MIKEYVESERKEYTEYELCFDDGANNGFGFPCDKNGNIDTNIHPDAKANYEYCMQHPEKFVRFNKVVKYTRSYREPAHGKCECGEIVILTNDYFGACQCPRCGQWYNLWGQELLPPERWED